MEQSVHRPLSQSGLPIVRRVNSAIGERVGLDLLRAPPNHPAQVQGSGFGVRDSRGVTQYPEPCGSGNSPGSNKQVFRCWDEGKERVDGAERPSTLNQVWSCRLTVASIPQSANEDCVDPLRGTTPPP